MRRKGLAVFSVTVLMVSACGTGSPSGTAPAGSLGASAAPGESITLNLASYDAPGGLEAGQSATHLKEEIERLSGGRISVDSHFSEALFSQAEVLEAVDAGLADISAFFTDPYAAQMPMWNALVQVHDMDLSLRGTPQSQIELNLHLMDEFPQFREELAALNMRDCALVPLAPHVMMTNRPVETLEDLQGLKMRVSGTNMPQTFAAGGATPVAIAFGEVYQAVASGTADGQFNPPDILEAMGFEEVASHITVVGDSGSVPLLTSLMFVVRLETYEELSADDQRIIDEACTETQQWIIDSIDSRHTEAMQQLDERGAEIHNFDEADLEEWSASIPDFLAQAADSLDGQGLPGTDLVEAIQDFYANR